MEEMHRRSAPKREKSNIKSSATVSEVRYLGHSFVLPADKWNHKMGEVDLFHSFKVRDIFLNSRNSP